MSEISKNADIITYEHLTYNMSKADLRYRKPVSFWSQFDCVRFDSIVLVTLNCYYYPKIIPINGCEYHLPFECILQFATYCSTWTKDSFSISMCQLSLNLLAYWFLFGNELNQTICYYSASQSLLLFFVLFIVLFIKFFSSIFCIFVISRDRIASSLKIQCYMRSYLSMINDDLSARKLCHFWPFVKCLPEKQINKRKIW